MYFEGMLSLTMVNIWLILFILMWRVFWKFMIRPSLNYYRMVFRLVYVIEWYDCYCDEHRIERDVTSKDIILLNSFKIYGYKGEVLLPPDKIKILRNFGFDI